MTETTLPAPPGYKSLVPFDKDEHKNLGVISEHRFGFASSLHAIYLSAVEFAQAARHFPIVFTKTDDMDTCIPMVVTGIREKENLFVNNEGQWQDGIYVPAYVRRYPFYTAQIERESVSDEHMICVDPNGLSKDNPALLDSKGNATKQWEGLQTFIRDMEIAKQTTTLFTSMLTKHDLLEPFEANIHQNATNNKFRLSGMSKISDEKLKALPADTLQELVANDFMFLIHVHKLSMDNFRLLLDRATADD